MRHFFALLLFAASTSSALASPITYTINRSVGTATVVGTLTTDGIFGTLGAADFLSYSITVTSASEGPVTITSANPDSMLILTGPSVTATSTNLLFDFGGPIDSRLDIRSRGTPIANVNFAFYDLSNSATFPASDAESAYVFRSPTQSDFQVAARSGSLVFASVDRVAVVPEPESIVLLAIGSLAALAGLRRRAARIDVGSNVFPERAA